VCIHAFRTLAVYGIDASAQPAVRALSGGRIAGR
jgi:hypothetical protein